MGERIVDKIVFLEKVLYIVHHAFESIILSVFYYLESD